MGKSRLAKMVFFIAFVFCLAAIAARATFPASQTLAHYARPDFGSNKEPAVYKLSGQSGAQILFYSWPILPISFLIASLSIVARRRQRNRTMRRSRVMKASRYARLISSAVPRTAAGAGTPQ